MDRKKYLNYSFSGDGEVFCNTVITYPVYEQFKQQIDELKKQFPSLSISTGTENTRKVGTTNRDSWGCLWSYGIDNLQGVVTEHPLINRDNLKGYKVPSPADYADWEKTKSYIKQSREKGELPEAGVEHGFLFLKLTYLRGFEKCMIDIADKNPLIYELRDMITDYWMDIVKRYIAMGIELISFGDDLGLQKSLPISPSSWRDFIKPAYKKIFSCCRESNVYVYLHTDGYVLDIIPDLVECGVNILNPQDIVNGIDNLERLARGKVAIDLDIDRQSLTVFGKKEEIESHIFNCIKKLGSPKGGLSMICGVYPGTPIENIESVLSAMDKYRLYWTLRS
jgi:uroporphyrinogen decarboxylase